MKTSVIWKNKVIALKKMILDTEVDDKKRMDGLIEKKALCENAMNSCLRHELGL